jgi:hypothetical protein
VVCWCVGVQDGEGVLNAVRLHESKLTCVLCTAVCKATKTNATVKALSVSDKLVMSVPRLGQLRVVMVSRKRLLGFM